VDIPPPPSPSSPDDAPPPGAPAGSPYGAPAGPPPPPPPPYSGGQPSSPQPPYGQQQGPYEQKQPPYDQGQSPYGQQQPYEQASPYGPGAQGAPGPYVPPYAGQVPPQYDGQAPSPYGMTPYPGQPQGWFAVQQTTNGMSIASLVLGLTCVPILGVIFGIVGLRQIKRNGQRGRGMAIAGVTLNGIGTILLAVVVTLAVIGAMNEGNTQVRNLNAGQCFNTVGDSLSDYGNSGARSTSVDVVDCERAHDAEAFDVFEIDSTPDEPFPGVDEESTVAQHTCSTGARDYLDGKSPRSGTGLYFYLPPKSGWERHQRTVICFFGSRDGKVTGSEKDNSADPGDTGVPSDPGDQGTQGTDGDPGFGV
jgi:hypothetical protein